MRITAKIYKVFENNGTLKALSSICFNGEFLINDVRIVDCKNGLEVFMPSKKVKDNFFDICFPINEELRQKIKNTVLNAYDEYIKIAEGAL